uniref:Clc-like protein n=1 Tax=Onchocerca volvulus TaxID=6282 RepID=A0A2K6W2T6_ONCVO
MNSTEESQSKCGQKTALSLFFLLELIAYVLGCIALISPSWQYVYLENGRTEHHHGLWLDCKRDYSHDYGRSREYYETLYRLNRQQSPFDQFFLPSLLCVYKFDYYIDTEDLYDHNHDENRLQDDANQHLLLGWKIASLAALGFAALTASAALLLSICAFCHRTLICAAAVLVTVAALLSSVGLLVFYIWANYQDNNIIKEEDGIYQQYFGWAFHVQIAATTMQFLASFAGCAVTSIAFRKNRTKLVKIEVVDKDSSTLLDRTLPFKRSFSAIYKLDSSDLQKWEKDYTNLIQSEGIAKQRATSVPNFKKYPGKSQHNPQENKINTVHRKTKSTSNLFTNIDQSNLSTASETFSSTSKIPPPFSFPVPKSILKASSKQPSTASNVNRRLSDDLDLTYEYLPVDSVPNSQSTETVNKSITTVFPSTSLFGQIKGVPSQRTHSESSINVYDKVYEHIPEQEQASDEDAERSTLINDVPSCSSANSSKLAFSHSIPETIIVSTDRCSSTDMRPNFPVPSKMAPRHDIDKTLVTAYPEMQPSAATSNLRDFFAKQSESSHFSNEHSANHVSDDIAINTFDFETFTERERSIRNLAFRSKKNESIEAFERINSSENNSLNKCMLNKKKILDSTIKFTLLKNGDRQVAYDNAISIPSMYLGDELDRSVGSSDTFENRAVVEGSGAQWTDEAQLCLNLFMNGGVTSLLARSSSSDGLTETKRNNFTTV